MCYCTLYFLEVLKKRISSFSSISNRGLKPWLVFFLLNFIPLTFFTIGYWPGNFSPDGSTMWSQAVGINTISRVHSATVILLMRLCFKIYMYPYSFVIFQSLCFSSLFAFILNRLHKQGWKVSSLICISFVTAIIPSTYGMLSHLKATVFHIAILWVVYLLIIQWQNPVRFYKSPKNIAAFGFSVACVYLFRRNGFMIMIPCVVSLFCIIKVLSVRKMIKPVSSLVLSIIIIIIVEGPIFSAMGVYPDTAEGNLMSTAVAKPLLSLYATDKYLPDDILDVMDNMLPLEYWKERYDRSNFDPFYWGDPRPSLSIPNNEAIIIYLRILKMYPAQVISNRLDGINFFWNLIDPDWALLPVNSNWVYEGFIEQHSEWVKQEWVLNDFAFRNSENPLRFYSDGLRNISYRYPLIRSLVWQDGIFVCLSFLLLIHAIAQKKRGIVISILTLFALALPYIFYQHWQHVEYTWFYPLCTIMILLFVISPYEESNNDGSYSACAKTQ